MELTFMQLCRGDFLPEDDPVWLRPEVLDIGGGRIELADIDKLASRPEAQVVRITGLRQDSFEYFIRTYGGQLKAIEFFKNKLVEDWSPLGSLKELEYVHWFSNQRIDRLWDMSENTALKGLCISDFSRLHSIEGIGSAPALKYFAFQDAIWDRSVLDSLSPLVGTGITHLSFGGKRITDESLAFLEGMPKLKVFDFACNRFTTEQVAWAAANFPELRGYSLCAKRDFDDLIYRPTPEGGHEFLPGAVIIGKRKPHLSYKKDAARIQKYVDSFEALKREYRGRSYSEVFGEGARA